VKESLFGGNDLLKGRFDPAVKERMPEEGEGSFPLWVYGKIGRQVIC